MPRRVLHVVGRLDRGGVETWLLAVLRRTDPASWTTHFLVHTDEPAAYDDDVRALGGQIHRTRPMNRSTRSVDRTATLARRFYLGGMCHLSRRHATVGLAASAAAAAALFGNDWRSDPRWRILHYGIDLAPFRLPPEPAGVRTELGLPLDAFVVGHVGRFDGQKDQVALVEALPALMRQEPSARLLFVGADGPGSVADQRARAFGVADRIVYAGVRGDVARLMLGAMDVFALPSRYEGLPLVALEAQAAGLPCVLSDGVSDEADAIPSLITRVPLHAGPGPWADAIARLRTARAPFGTTLTLLDQAGFSSERSAAHLFALYDQALA